MLTKKYYTLNALKMYRSIMKQHFTLLICGPTVNIGYKSTVKTIHGYLDARISPVSVRDVITMKIELQIEENKES